MEAVPERLTIHAAHHPNTEVQRLGIGIDDPYVEQCWTPVVGPSAVLFLRRVPLLWRDEYPAEVDLYDLGRSIGLGRVHRGPAGKVRDTVERVVRYGLGRWGGDDEVEVFTEVAPLTPRLLERAGGWAQRAHESLLDAHIARLAGAAPPTPETPGRAPVERITERLDLLQRPAPPAAPLGR